MQSDIQSPREITEKRAESASQFWEWLAPEKPLFAPPSELLYRGQGDAFWGLEPSILRPPETKIGLRTYNGVVPSDLQVFKEWAYLKSFVDDCDSIGLPIPNDSPAFRNAYLNQNAPSGPGTAFLNTHLWPDPELYALLALAQHHGVPTRLLDWSRRSYVAAYFAISDALTTTLSKGRKSDYLAVWVFNNTRAFSPSELEVIRVPSGNNLNLAAQAGVFTLLRQQGHRGKGFEGEIALDKFFLARDPRIPIPLLKVTLHTAHANEALRLCDLYGVTGATLFPDYYGAARAAKDMMHTAWRIED